MNLELTRRDFLELAGGTGAVFATGLWTLDAMAQAKALLPEAERIVVTVVVDNLADATRPNYKIARRPGGGKTPLDSAMHAEHGLAYHVEVVVDGKSHAFLYDFGAQAQGVMRNLDLLGLDMRKVEAMALSHDHWDHEAALPELLQAKAGEFGRGLPLYVGERFFVGTYSKRPDGQIRNLSTVSREQLESTGIVKIVEVKAATAIVPGAMLTGPVRQVTDYEKIPQSFLTKRGEEFVPEDFIGEQSIVMNAKGKGLVLLTACAHRGVVNILKHVQQVTGVEKVHAVIGGLHLTNANQVVIDRTVADLKAARPDYIVPCHCSGHEAIGTVAREMPEQFILNTAGTRYVFEA